MFFFFFFKQKTAYELRISDWSSDVCSSDLMADDSVLATHGIIGRPPAQKFVTVTDAITIETEIFRFASAFSGLETIAQAGTVIAYDGARPVVTPYDRSEERRVGTESVSASRSRWSPEQ